MLPSSYQNVDVLAGLKSLPDATADLIIADPPYGIAKNFGLPDSYTDINEWKDWCTEWLAECKRVLNSSGSIFLYGIHHYLCYNQVQLYDLNMNYRRQIIWHYENGFCGNRNIRATYEPLLWFSKTERFFFEEIREPYKSSDRLRYAITKNGKTWHPNPLGRLVGDVWSIPTLAGRRFAKERVGHPTQKPLALCERLVKHFSPANGVVVVPFGGSGSECVAAKELGRTYHAFEINVDYCRVARERLAGIKMEPQTKARAMRNELLEPIWSPSDIGS